MHFQLFLIFTLNIAASIEGGKRTQSYRHGGEILSIQDAPYLVAIEDGSDFVCAGIIVSKQHILTSGNCVEKYIPKGSSRTEAVPISVMNIRYGGSQILTGNQKEIKKLILHPNYEYKFNDIAIIVLQSAIPFSDAAYPIALSREAPRPETTASIIGWGEKETIKKTKETLKILAAKITVISLEDCSKIYQRPSGVINKRVVCGVAKTTKNTCYKGSAMVQDDLLVGVFSFASSCFFSEAPYVYTNIREFKNFIDRNTDRSVQWVTPYPPPTTATTTTTTTISISTYDDYDYYYYNSNNNNNNMGEEEE